MRKLVFCTLLLSSLGMASGCIISSDDDDDDDDDGGRFAATWTLESGGAAISCADVDSGGVEILSTLSGTTQGVSDTFSCENMAGTTGILPLGGYTVIVSVLDQNDAALGSSMPRNASLTDPGVDEDLGNFVFDFPPATGDVLFVVDYGAASGSNCAGGAGGEIVEDQGTNLVLVGSTACFAVSLEVDGTVDTQDICTDIPLCVESDIQQALLALDPDDYELEITGLFDNGGTTVACFRSIDIFEISDGDEDLGSLLVPFDDTENATFCATI